MARCKATNLATILVDPPPPYSRYEVDDNYVKDTRNSSRINEIPRAEIRSPVVTTATSGKMASCRCCTYCIGAIVAIVLCTFITIEIFPYPLRASCTVKWRFDEPCTFVMQRLRCQILKWTGCSDCGQRGNRCLYSLKEPKIRENCTIRATHLSLNLKFVDDIKIEFEETKNNSCVATAKSLSRAWFVMFDYGTNYCNLRNLVDGAGLVTDRGFMELTNEAICTQFNTAFCV